MTENMNSLCNAAAIRSLIEENKKIEEEIGELEQLFWQNIIKLAMLGDVPSMCLLIRTGGDSPFDIDPMVSWN